VKLRCEPAPLLLGFVLGPLLEENLRRAMILSRGDPTTFVTRPISAIAAGAIAVAVLVVVFLPSVKAKREQVFQEED
jgi:putative tricarboxylic transport membrane protein